MRVPFAVESLVETLQLDQTFVPGNHTTFVSVLVSVILGFICCWFFLVNFSSFCSRNAYFVLYFPFVATVSTKFVMRLKVLKLHKNALEMCFWPQYEENKNLFKNLFTLISRKAIYIRTCLG